MKQLLSIMFLTIFSFQIIPIKEIGKLLWSGQMTEEVHNTCDNQKSSSNDEVHKKLWYHHYADHAGREMANRISFPTFPIDEALIKCLHLDVALQPPNC